MTEQQDWLQQGIRAANEGDAQTAQKMLAEAIRRLAEAGKANKAN